MLATYLTSMYYCIIHGVYCVSTVTVCMCTLDVYVCVHTMCVCVWEHETRKPRVSCLVFRVYRYKHENLKSKHETNTKKVETRYKHENLLKHDYTYTMLS